LNKYILYVDASWIDEIEIGFMTVITAYVLHNASAGGHGFRGKMLG